MSELQPANAEDKNPTTINIKNSQIAAGTKAIEEKKATTKRCTIRIANEKSEVHVSDENYSC